MLTGKYSLWLICAFPFRSRFSRICFPFGDFASACPFWTWLVSVFFGVLFWTAFPYAWHRRVHLPTDSCVMETLAPPTPGRPVPYKSRTGFTAGSTDLLNFWPRVSPLAPGAAASMTQFLLRENFYFPPSDVNYLWDIFHFRIWSWTSEMSSNSGKFNHFLCHFPCS